jgi:cytochrome d ubiquinol oxidase subunit I
MPHQSSGRFPDIMISLIAARCQMGISLAFHIIFACVGVAMPLMMVLAEWHYKRTGEEESLELARRWAQGTAILFAVGAVSGTVLSFELGLLWPRLMAFAGAIFGWSFALEGFAFFSEAIFLGIYLYGWERVSRLTHMAAGVMVAVSGAASSYLVMTANSWMQTPSGFKLVNGNPVNVSAVEAFLNPAAVSHAIHMTTAAYVATGFVVAGIHSFFLLRDPKDQFHRRALAIALIVGGIFALTQPISGDRAGEIVALYQPIKLAAMEGDFQTTKGAPLRIGGYPEVKSMRTVDSIEIPYLLSILAYRNPHATVKGLAAFPRDLWPPFIPLIHLSFDAMAGFGFVLIGLTVWALYIYWRTRSVPVSKWFLRALILCSPLGMIAVELGWIVTEIGRQPWVVYGVMRTSQAVSPMPGLIAPFITITILYFFLMYVVVFLLWRRLIQPPVSIPA